MTRRPPAPSRLTTHPYVADEAGVADHRGTRYCAAPGCGLPEKHQRHDLPDTDPETRAITARITGEHRED